MADQYHQRAHALITASTSIISEQLQHQQHQQPSWQYLRVCESKSVSSASNGNDHSKIAIALIIIVNTSSMMSTYPHIIIDMSARTSKAAVSVDSQHHSTSKATTSLHSVVASVSRSISCRQRDQHFQSNRNNDGINGRPLICMSSAVFVFTQAHVQTCRVCRV